MINVVGEHATYHLKFDAPLTSDIESLARPMSHWLGRVTDAREVQTKTEEALKAACAARGISTLILAADAAWGEVSDGAPHAVAIPEKPVVAEARIAEAIELIRKSRRPALFLGGMAMRGKALERAGRIAAATGAALFTERAARWQRGAGRVAPRAVPYNIELAIEALREIDAAILIGGRAPVGFFAYPGKPGWLLPSDCPVMELAAHENDLCAVLEALAERLGATDTAPSHIHPYGGPRMSAPVGALTPDAISVTVARHLPENAIICEESITSAGRLTALAPTMAPHDHLPLTGGAIGEGIPLAIGAAIACPDRKVVALQADGSGMYTVQGLWTQARESLDVLTVVFSNRGYSILKGEMRNVGVNDFGENARRMLDIDDPALDWCALAKGMGVASARAETAEEFERIFADAISHQGPFLIEAII
jgi:acetolactate synthase I/II/III large subunit